MTIALWMGAKLHQGNYIGIAMKYGIFVNGIMVWDVYHLLVQDFATIHRGVKVQVFMVKVKQNTIFSPFC
jgi:hypothetical protein